MRRHAALVEMYADNLVARKVFDYWAKRKKHRGECGVTRTAQEVGLDEEEVKDFFRLLTEAGLGRYVKRSRGGQARFVWGTSDKPEFDCDYSLISVARVAQGHDEPLDGAYDNPEGIYDELIETDENSAEQEFRHSGLPPLMTIRVEFRGVPIRIDLPNDFDPETEMGDLSELISIVVKNKRR